MRSSRQHHLVGHLPLEISPMIDRRQETADIRRLLASHRLVTLTGPGGIGKTRTALHAAHASRRTYADGAWFVDLGAVRDPALVGQVVLETLKVRDSSTRGAAQVLVEHLRGRHVLLVLDNCEHVLAEAAGLVADLLKGASGAHVLATSRQPLGVPGEAAYRMQPLAVPDQALVHHVSDVSGYAAVELLTTRARAALGDFAVDASNYRDVARLCARLEGLPLALELAAPRLKVMTPGELLQRLDDRADLLTTSSHLTAPRHRTLLAAVAWSHDLCTPAEQLLWRRTSVFAGTFSLAAAEAVCADDDLPRDRVQDALLGLVDKSVVQGEQVDGRMRFRMLGPVRDFGAARLEAAGETEALRAALGAWASAQVTEMADAWLGPRQADLAAVFREELPNLRAVLEFCASRAEHARTGQFTAAMAWFGWLACGHLAEGRLWLERLLAADTTPSVERAMALGCAAYVAATQGDTEQGDRAATECEALGRELGEPVVAAFGIHMRAACAFLGNAFDEAADHYRRARSIDAEVEVPEQWRLTEAVQRAAMHAFAGDTSAASELFHEVERACERHGDRWLRSYAVWGQGLVAFEAGDHDAAETALLRSIEMKRPFVDIIGLAFALDVLAWVLAAKGRHRRAAPVLGAASALWSRSGTPQCFAEFRGPRRAACEAAVRQALGDAAFEEAVREGASAPLDATLRGLLDRDRERPGRPAAASAPVLTRRELEVAGLVAEGLSNQEIADRLVISVRTAEGHVENVLRKLGFHSRTQIAAWFASPGG